jgi:predicted dehydrogenase
MKGAMPSRSPRRRTFLQSTLAAAGAAALARRAAAASDAGAPAKPPRIRFSVIGVDHPHIHRQVEAVMRGGGAFVAFYAKEPKLAADFAKRYPQAKQAGSEKEILESDVQLIATSGIPAERAPLGIQAMKHGKDFLSDKPGMTTLQQLAEVKRVQAQTRRIYSIMYSERHENRATVKAGELVKAGAIGQVIQTMGVGPHRLSPETRPAWFFQKDRYGGILVDLASHQFDQFLYFTGSTKADIVASQVGNVHHPEYPGLEDFGDVMLRGDKGTGYIRVDWFTPKGLATWGDARLTVLGTDGYVEVRKNIDLAGRPGADHLLIVDKEGTRYLDCKKEPLPFGERLVDDVLNRTETAMPQQHCFLAMELALKAEKAARKIS